MDEKLPQILTQWQGGYKGYLGRVGTPTKMYDCKWKRLYVGDIVIVFDKTNPMEKFMITFVGEEEPSISSHIGIKRQFIIGIDMLWNNNCFLKYDKIDEFIENNKYYVLKVKDFTDIKDGEKWCGVFSQEQYESFWTKRDYVEEEIKVDKEKLGENVWVYDF